LGEASQTGERAHAALQVGHYQIRYGHGLAFLEPQQGAGGRCVVILESGTKIALAETADAVAQKINATLT
jgi:hypothetical protein